MPTTRLPKVPDVTCPLCEARQAFTPKYRERSNGRIEVLLECERCPWHHHLRWTTSRIEKLSRQKQRAAALAVREKLDLGYITDSTRYELDKCREAWVNAKHQLYREIWNEYAVNGQA